MPDREHWIPRLKPLGVRAEIPYRRDLVPAEAVALRAGLWPRDMDDRWVVFLSDDGLTIHRSWSGNCIYSLPRLPSSEGMDVLGPLLVCDDPAIYRRDDDKREIERVEALIGETVERNRTS